MDEEFRTRVLGLGEFVKGLPENLQVSAFELLLGEYLSERRPQTTRPDLVKDGVVHEERLEPPDVGAKTGNDLQMSDLHIKARRFLEKSGVTLDDVNQLFYKEGEAIAPMYEDLKTTKVATMQVNLTLLMAFRRALETGDFEVSGEDVRDECKVRKCYDKANFVRAFANNKSLFDGLEQYSSEDPLLRLSEEGRAQLATLVKALR